MKTVRRATTSGTATEYANPDLLLDLENGKYPTYQTPSECNLFQLGAFISSPWIASERRRQWKLVQPSSWRISASRRGSLDDRKAVHRTNGGRARRIPPTGFEEVTDGVPDELSAQTGSYPDGVLGTKLGTRMGSVDFFQPTTQPTTHYP
jgi:hypothetical protein